MVKLEEIFDIKYGNQFDLCKMKKNDYSNIHFVGRAEKDNGVTAKVEPHPEVKPYPPGLITVALGGSILSSFVQVKPFYTGQNIVVLTPLEEMSIHEKLFYCNAIKKNAFKFSTHGREANRTIRNLVVPSLDEIPKWIYEVDLNRFNNANDPLIKEILEPPKISKLCRIDDLFEIKNGINIGGIKEYSKRFKGSIMFIRPASTHKRTLRSFIDKRKIKSKDIYSPGTLFVSTNGEGSHTYAYVSTEAFVPNSDVSVLIPKRKMSIEEKLYYSKCISANRYLFSYGRKPKGRRLKNIKIPDLSDDEIVYVQKFIRSLKFSSTI